MNEEGKLTSDNRPFLWTSPRPEQLQDPRISIVFKRHYETNLQSKCWRVGGRTNPNPFSATAINPHLFFFFFFFSCLNAHQIPPALLPTCFKNAMTYGKSSVLCPAPLPGFLPRLFP